MSSFLFLNFLIIYPPNTNNADGYIFYIFQNRIYDIHYIYFYPRIHKYDELKSLIDDIVSKHQKENMNNNDSVSVYYLQNEPNYGCNYSEYMDYVYSQPKYDKTTEFHENVNVITNIQSPGSLNNWMHNITIAYDCPSSPLLNDVFVRITDRRWHTLRLFYATLPDAASLFS